MSGITASKSLIPKLLLKLTVHTVPTQAQLLLHKDQKGQGQQTRVTFHTPSCPQTQSLKTKCTASLPSFLPKPPKEQEDLRGVCNFNLTSGKSSFSTCSKDMQRLKENAETQRPFDFGDFFSTNATTTSSEKVTKVTLSSSTGDSTNPQAS